MSRQCAIIQPLQCTARTASTSTTSPSSVLHRPSTPATPPTKLGPRSTASGLYANLRGADRKGEREAHNQAMPILSSRTPLIVDAEAKETKHGRYLIIRDHTLPNLIDRATILTRPVAFDPAAAIHHHRSGPPTAIEWALSNRKKHSRGVLGS